jgi:hypothetical protein
MTEERHVHNLTSGALAATLSTRDYTSCPGLTKAGLGREECPEGRQPAVELREEVPWDARLHKIPTATGQREAGRARFTEKDMNAPTAHDSRGVVRARCI